MDNHLINKLDYIEASLGDVLSMLSNYLRLNLSLMLLTNIRTIHSIKQDIIDKKTTVDIRDVVALEKYTEEIKELHKIDSRDVLKTGHKIACLLFKVAPLILEVAPDFSFNRDYQRYLLSLSEYCITIARLINKELQVEEIYF